MIRPSGRNPKRADGKMIKPTRKEIKEMEAFARRSATSTMDAIGKKCLRNALESKDYSDDNVQRFVKGLRS